MKKEHHDMTPHNAAEVGMIAKDVLLPGDPARARFVAENFLDNASLVSEIRGIPCFTGTYKGKRMSVMASGMGGPSVGIYSWELFAAYKVDNIVRIGTCGGYQPSLEVGDLVFALTASTDSAWAHQYGLKGTFSPVCSPSLLGCMHTAVERLGYRYTMGMVLSSDLFSSYNALGADSWKAWADMGALAQDMETYALYCNAMRAGKHAFSILTMTDNCATGKSFADADRMKGNEKMIKVALEGLYLRGKD
jgi:purine-nucleoside phosphorylase